MSRQVPRIRGKDHRPRHCGWSTIKLTIDEVPNAPEKKSGRPAQRDQVGYREDRELVPSGEQDDRDRHSQNRPVKREPSPPQRKYLERMRRVLIAPVNEHVKQARTDEHPGHKVPDQGVELRASEPRASALDPPQHQPIAEHVSDEIHHAVPSNRYRTNRYYRRRNARVRNHHFRLMRAAEGESRRAGHSMERILRPPRSSENGHDD